MEVRAGIEPAFEDLQSSASPLCHRTPGVPLTLEPQARCIPRQPTYGQALGSAPPHL